MGWFWGLTALGCCGYAIRTFIKQVRWERQNDLDREQEREIYRRATGEEPRW